MIADNTDVFADTMPNHFIINAAYRSPLKPALNVQPSADNTPSVDTYTTSTQLHHKRRQILLLTHNRVARRCYQQWPTVSQAERCARLRVD